MKFLFLSIWVVISTTCQSQSFVVCDTTISFKNNRDKAQTEDEITPRQAILNALRSKLIDRRIKSFHSTDMTGKKWSSKELNAKTIVINFWFTDCKPCIEEMIYLKKLMDENDNIIFIAPSPENETRLKKLLKQYGVNSFLDLSSSDKNLTLKIENFTVYLFVNKDGIISEARIGYVDEIKKKMRKEIAELLN